MNTERKVILIVDDSSLITDRLEEMLHDIQGIDSILKASDYDEAISIIAKHKTDILFLDIHLPGKNGIELLGFIKDNYPKIKVVMLTNEASDYYRNICKKAGAAYFVDKSKEFELIPGIVSSLN
jgi:DNA-binding NarL/FixJ family response regulator